MVDLGLRDRVSLGIARVDFDSGALACGGRVQAEALHVVVRDALHACLAHDRFVREHVCRCDPLGLERGF